MNELIKEAKHNPSPQDSVNTPAVGAYLLPVQTFRVQYALQVLAVIDCADSHEPGIKQLQCRRWGLDAQRRPVDDGHHNTSYYTGRFPPVGRSAWRIDDGLPSWGSPMYFKQIPAPIVAGQLELFA